MVSLQKEIQKLHFSSIIAQNQAKAYLKNTLKTGRISHAQLFVGPPGCGHLPLALAYARGLLCNEDNKVCHRKMDILAHPDLHFFFPTLNLEAQKSCKSFLKQWRSFLMKMPYGSLSDWYDFLGSEKKQGQIGVESANEVIKALQLKSYEGGRKVLIMWMPEKMHPSAANKLLKIIEEPPKDTVFLLVTDSFEKVLLTIVSRTQILWLKPLSTQTITEAIIEKEKLSQEQAVAIALQSRGNYHLAQQLIAKSEIHDDFQTKFIEWVRMAFLAKKQLTSLESIYKWAEDMSSWPLEKQIQWIVYAIEIFRQALLNNYSIAALQQLKITKDQFRWESFSGYIHGANVIDILEVLNEMALHLERNLNPKWVWLDGSIILTRHLHKPIKD